MPEAVTVERWLYGRLTGDATLAGIVGDRVFSSYAPAGTADPFVVFHLQGGTDTRGVGPVRFLTRALFLVRAVAAASSFAAVEPAAASIDRVLQGSSGAAGDGYVYSITREQPHALAELTDGVEYRHLGGLYRFDVRQQ